MFYIIMEAGLNFERKFWENKDKSDYFIVVNVRDDVVTKMYYEQNRPNYF
jgi:hypothetical protein